MTIKNMPFNKTTKSVFSFFVRIFLSGALLWYIFSKIDLRKTAEILRSADLTFMMYAAAAFLVIYVILLYRWFIFIKALGLESRVRDIVRYYFMGLFGNLFLPTSIGGDFIKIYGLCRNSTQKTRVVASVLLDRISGFASIVLVSIAAFVLGYGYFEDHSLLIPIGGIGAVSLAFVFVLFNERMYRFCCRIFSSFPKIEEALMGLHYDIVLMKDKRREGLAAIVLSCFSQVVYAVCWYFIARALSQETSVIYFLIFVPLTCIAASFPSIGGLGVREIGAVYLFGKAGMEPGIAASISLINFFFMVVVGLIGGIVYVSTLSSGRIQYHLPDTGADSRKP